MSLNYILLAADYILVELPDLCKESIPAIHFSCLSILGRPFCLAKQLVIKLSDGGHDYSGSWQCSGFGYTYCLLATHYLADMHVLSCACAELSWPDEIAVVLLVSLPVRLE